MAAVILLAAGCALPAARATDAANLTTLHRFFPTAHQHDLVQGTDGNFYGTTESGGNNGTGTVFRLTPAGVLTVIHAFSEADISGNNPDGRFPMAGLVLGNDGNFYGTTSGGGIGDGGTVFRITPAGVLTTLHVFTGYPNDGFSPKAALFLANDGNFYGTTYQGGSNGVGTVFQMNPAGFLTTLYSFGTSGSNTGVFPRAGVVQGTDGNFYGTTSANLPDDHGTVFRITSGGSLTTLHRFTGSDGESPQAALVQGADGTFYGTTYQGGSGGVGTVFKITAAGGFTDIHDFDADDRSNGSNPAARMVRAGDGSLYGTTTGGHVISTVQGTVFRIAPDGSFSTVHVFRVTDGSNPEAGLTLARDGNFYGTTSDHDFGGGDGHGTFFQLTPDGVLTTLYVEDTGDGPQAALVQGTDGNFYGTTVNGGAYAQIGGTIFRLTPAGELVTLHSFAPGDNTEYSLGGSEPHGDLIQASDGNFYGTTLLNGAYGYGTVFQMTPAGALTVVHPFNPNGTVNGGAYPRAGVIQGSDGNFYGTTTGINTNTGTIFKALAGGGFATLHDFSGDGSDGYVSGAALVEGTDGSFYGTLGAVQGASNQGTIFKVTPTGAFVQLHLFNGTDGTSPVAALARGNDGNFYGTTAGGGANGAGTAFKIASDGTFTLLHSFDFYTDGERPESALVLGRDGNFYGTTYRGGTVVLNGTTYYNGGTIFRMTPAGDFTTLYHFTGTAGGSDGFGSVAALIQAGDGSFYGTTESGGGSAYPYSPNGTIFKFDLLPAITSSLSPPSRAGVAFGYQITATNSPTSYGASGLPAGLSINTATGKISGAPTTAGTYHVTLQATNGNGTGSAVMTLVVKEAIPVITSSLNPPSRAGVAFSYQIVATNHPTSYGASGLPAGLSFSPSTGKIGGAPSVAGTFNVFLKATNSGGTGTATMTLVVKEALPVITSNLQPPSRQGVAFGYQITATNSPTSYGASNLPAGLGVNTATGKISGMPTTAGTYGVIVKATNSGGTGSATLNLVVKQAVPVITSALNPPSRAGVAFGYQIVATNSPTSYGASNLPPGLSVNTTTGKITGAPTKAGTYSVVIKATNSGGTGSATLSLVVKQALPVITSSLSPQGKQGVAFSYQITATNSPTSYGATGLPAGLSVNTTTGKITGTPTKAGTYSVIVKAANSGGTGSATLNLVVKPPA